MLFNSFSFALFFPIVTLLYFIFPHKYRWLHLLIASCVFYAFFIPAYLLILFAIILIDYYAGIVIEKAAIGYKKHYLAISILSNIGLLFVFKYYNFFIDNLNTLFSYYDLKITEPSLNIILPIGLSFHTFQAMSYTIEVYRGNQKAEKHIGIYALYVMFYPQLVAGPIERPQNMLPQFREEHKFDTAQTVSGLRLMLWGMFKKVVIADRLALLTEPVFNAPTEHTSLAILIAIVFFSFQIFCDFSGYSDIAIGAARVMGFRLMRNFNRPYHAKSIPEFWQKWHISLSTWFRDYLYIPLGGNRVSLMRWVLITLFVFLVSGLWHGASWTFIVWGGLHGFYLVIARLKEKWVKKNSISFKLPTILSIFFSFLLVTFAWIFFRSKSISDAFYIIGEVFKIKGSDIKALLYEPDFHLAKPAFGRYELMLSCSLIVLLEFIHTLQAKLDCVNFFERFPKPVRWAMYYSVLLMVILWGVFENREFIYFQF